MTQQLTSGLDFLLQALKSCNAQRTQCRDTGYHSQFQFQGHHTNIPFQLQITSKERGGWEGKVIRKDGRSVTLHPYELYKVRELIAAYYCSDNKPSQELSDKLDATLQTLSQVKFERDAAVETLKSLEVWRDETLAFLHAEHEQALQTLEASHLESIENLKQHYQTIFKSIKLGSAKKQDDHDQQVKALHQSFLDLKKQYELALTEKETTLLSLRKRNGLLKRQLHQQTCLTPRPKNCKKYTQDDVKLIILLRKQGLSLYDIKTHPKMRIKLSTQTISNILKANGIITKDGTVGKVRPGGKKPKVLTLPEGLTIKALAELNGVSTQTIRQHLKQRQSTQ